MLHGKTCSPADNDNDQIFGAEFLPRVGKTLCNKNLMHFAG